MELDTCNFTRISVLCKTFQKFNTLKSPSGEGKKVALYWRNLKKKKIYGNFEISLEKIKKKKQTNKQTNQTK